MTTLSPRHRLTEEALLLLVHTQGSLDTALVHRRGLGRPGAGGRLLGAERQEEQYALLRYVSIAEAYLDAMSLQGVSGSVDPSVPRQALLLNEWEISSTSTWPKREEAFKVYHGTALSSCAGYPALMAAVQVRNSIAHGLGRLTARQRTSPNLANRTKAINVVVGGGRMHLSDDTLTLVADACNAFIRDVDSQLPLP